MEWIVPYRMKPYIKAVCGLYSIQIIYEATTSGVILFRGRKKELFPSAKQDAVNMIPGLTPPSICPSVQPFMLLDISSFFLPCKSRLYSLSPSSRRSRLLCILMPVDRREAEGPESGGLCRVSARPGFIYTVEVICCVSMPSWLGQMTSLH